MLRSSQVSDYNWRSTTNSTACSIPRHWQWALIECGSSREIDVEIDVENENENDRFSQSDAEMASAKENHTRLRAREGTKGRARELAGQTPRSTRLFQRGE